MVPPKVMTFAVQQRDNLRKLDGKDWGAVEQWNDPGARCVDFNGKDITIASLDVSVGDMEVRYRLSDLHSYTKKGFRHP